MMSFINDESGATAVEYGLLSGFWFGVIITAYAMVFSSMRIPIQNIIDAMVVI